MKEKNTKLEEKVKEASVDGRLACAKAHLLAEKEGFSLKEIGEMANSLKIKIVTCELGCF